MQKSASRQTVMDKIDKHFPFTEYRQGQREAIHSFLNAHNSDKNHIIFEGPCGSGKSVIAYTLSKFYNRTFWICPQKFLQDQIMADFGSLGVVDLKGRSTYPCTFWDTVTNILPEHVGKAVLRKAEAAGSTKWTCKSTTHCAEGVCRMRDDASACAECFPTNIKQDLIESYCPYWKRIGEAQQSRICLMNFKSFLCQTTLTERFTSRDLLIVDEAHGLESEILDFVSLTIKDLPFKHRKISIPKMSSVSEYKQHFMNIKLLDVIQEMATSAKYAGRYKDEDELMDLHRKLSYFNTKANDSSWVFEHTAKGAVNKVQFKPIFIDDMAYDLVFKHARKTLLMSATILEPKHIYEALGLEPHNVFAYRMKNRFPSKNRPIYFTPSGSLNYRSKHDTYPKLVRDIDGICKSYPDSRGIIHTHNFEIAELLIENCDSSNRFLFQKNFKTKKEMLAKHTKNSDSIIVAPAMHEGLDLKDDLARFQIIVKVPYPNFKENKQLALRMEMDNSYYTWLTALKFAQSTGRVVRSEHDHADTYIMDQEFRRFYNVAKNMLPKWLKDAIIWD